MDDLGIAVWVFKISKHNQVRVFGENQSCMRKCLRYLPLAKLAQLTSHGANDKFLPNEIKKAAQTPNLSKTHIRYILKT